MRSVPLLRKVDAVTIPVSDIDGGLHFYRDGLGHEVLWRNDALGQAGLALPECDTEIVLSTHLEYAPNWLVSSVDDAAETVRTAGGRVITEPFDIPVGRVVVVTDAFDNPLVLLDLSKGRYATDDAGSVTGIRRQKVGDTPMSGHISVTQLRSPDPFHAMAARCRRCVSGTG
jgi:predicted enzyme related to lactoylglutathione lyase